ncbi:hypothetical protein VUR80DRAFT_8535 [Thermomyces stellatus]
MGGLFPRDLFSEARVFSRVQWPHTDESRRACLTRAPLQVLVAEPGYVLEAARPSGVSPYASRSPQGRKVRASLHYCYFLLVGESTGSQLSVPPSLTASQPQTREYHAFNSSVTMPTQVYR